MTQQAHGLQRKSIYFTPTGWRGLQQFMSSFGLDTPSLTIEALVRRALQHEESVNDPRIAAARSQ